MSSPNTSATGGYLLQTASAGGVDAGDALQNILQLVLVGITELDPTLVRPRWQPNPPNTPDENTSWAAFGVTGSTPDKSVYIAHSSGFGTGGAGTGGAGDTAQSLVSRDEVLRVLCTFYGPNADDNQQQFSMGLWLSQNREKLLLAGYVLQEVGDPITAPEQVNGQWRWGINVELILRRKQGRYYPVENLEGAQFTANVGNLPASTITVVNGEE